MRRQNKRRVPAQPIRLDDAQQQLAASGVNLARRLAGDYSRRYNLDRDECLSAAMARLVRAAALFKPELGFAFTSYAHKAIRNALWRVLDLEQQNHRIRSVAFGDNCPDAVDHRMLEEATSEIRDMVERVRRCLSPRLWEVVWAYFAEGHTLKEVARQQG
jgi:RNA polymerase sigma factor (sigma-70 family)